MDAIASAIHKRRRAKRQRSESNQHQAEPKLDCCALPIVRPRLNRPVRHKALAGEIQTHRHNQPIDRKQEAKKRRQTGGSRDYSDSRHRGKKCRQTKR
jgi:hypothetical protein